MIISVESVRSPHMFLLSTLYPTFYCGSSRTKVRLFLFFDQNHAFDRMNVPNCVRTHPRGQKFLPMVETFARPCIKTVMRAPGFYEFPSEILLNTRKRDKMPATPAFFELRHCRSSFFRGFSQYGKIKSRFTDAERPLTALFCPPGLLSALPHRRTPDGRRPGCHTPAA